MVGLIILSKSIKITQITLTHPVNLGKIEEDIVQLERFKCIKICQKMSNLA